MTTIRPWLLLGTALLAGCNAVALRHDSASSPYFNPASGARVVVLQEAVVPPNQLRVFYQYGDVVERSAVNPHYPNCNLELSTLAPDARRLLAGTYGITRIKRHHAPLANVGTVQVAELSLAFRRGGGPPGINFETVFYLQPLDDGNPEMRALNCSRWGDPGDDFYPTRQEIAEALGSLVRFDG
jgi:hypothetical protein